MPKMYSQEEKDAIIAKLKSVSLELMKEKGVKKTTVDEIVEKVGIPKGTFYLFYESKEALLFVSTIELHDTFEKMLMQDVEKIKDDWTPEKIAKIWVKHLLKAYETCLYNVIINDEFQLILKKLPKEVAEKHIEYDIANLEKLLNILEIKVKDVSLYSAALRGVFGMLEFRETIGEDCFEYVLYITVKGIFIQMLGGNKENE